MISASLTFVSPFGGLFALAVVAPLAAFRVSSTRGARGRALLGLPPPDSDRHIELLALAAVPLLIGVAAAGPALRTPVGRRVRTDAQAMFILDTSRSMAASARPGAATRFAQAQAAAVRLRDDVIPQIPSGAASLTTELLPHLFPTADHAAFDSTVENALGVEKPPPPFLTYGVLGTSFGPLASLRNRGFFNPSTKHRFAILLTDGESGPIGADEVGKALFLPAGYPPAPTFPGQSAPQPEPPVSLFIVRVGSDHDRIYNATGAVEAAYRPSPTAATTVEALAAAAHGHAFATADLDAAAAALRKAVGGGGSLQGVTAKTISLAPYVVLVAFLPLGLIIWRRNLSRV